ncbi:hypothetical protein BKA62DRAFT_39508 [Auriculariales sp. MPI-PUGE-AT-0066]|nr:hypothetical protein BKA62DRAFT_39508 [Auriculariales sp. MPI-PUGE-AT-0066]
MANVSDVSLASIYSDQTFWFTNLALDICHLGHRSNSRQYIPSATTSSITSSPLPQKPNNVSVLLEPTGAIGTKSPKYNLPPSRLTRTTRNPSITKFVSYNGRNNNKLLHALCLQKSPTVVDAGLVASEHAARVPTGRDWELECHDEGPVSRTQSDSQPIHMAYQYQRSKTSTSTSTSTSRGRTETGKQVRSLGKAHAKLPSRPRVRLHDEEAYE